MPELPPVPLDDDGAPINGFEVMAVKFVDGHTYEAGVEDAECWGLYVTYDGGPTMHVEDYPTWAEAEHVCAALAAEHDVEAITVTTT